MKFKFCSDGDCPLWALAGLHALGGLPVQLFRDVVQHVVEMPIDEGIMEILQDTNLSSRDDCRRAASVLRWTLRQAHRCECTGVQLAKDLLMLGMPRTHAAVLAETAEATRAAYLAQIKTNGFMINKLTEVTTSDGPEGTVETVKLTMHSEEVLTCEQRINELLVDKTQVNELLRELKRAKYKMDEISLINEID